MSEFDVVPKTSADDEDDAVLTTILYNSTDDTSLFGLFDAKNPYSHYSCKNGFSRTVSCARHCLFKV